MMLAIITSCCPPSMAGVMKKARPSTKTSRVLAPTPGRLSGRKTRRNAVKGDAIRLWAAVSKIAPDAAHDAQSDEDGVGEQDVDHPDQHAGAVENEGERLEMRPHAHQRRVDTPREPSRNIQA